MSKIFSSRPSIMLPIFLKDSVYFFWSEEHSLIDFDGDYCSFIPPALNSFDANAEELSRLSGGEELPLEVHINPSPFFNLYRVLSFGLNFSFRKLLKVPGEQPKYTAALSNCISLSFKKSLSFFLKLSISIYMKYILRYLICQAISLIFLIFFIASNQLR